MDDSVGKPRDLLPETVADKNRRVWDMALNLVHPAFFYVLFQMVILDHLAASPALSGRWALEPTMLGVYALQFLGAWTVFCTTLLRDMGYRSTWGTVLLLAALAAVVVQYVVIPEPADATAQAAWTFLAVQLALAGVGWPLTMVRWWRRKRGFLVATARAATEDVP